MTRKERPRTSWEARAGERPSPLAGIAETDPPIVVTKAARARAARMLEERTRPYVVGGRRLLTLQERNAMYVRRVFRICGRNVSATARVLGIGRATLYRMLPEIGLESPGQAKRRRDG